MIKTISVSGLDGSGKSSQIELLKTHFESKNQTTYYFHAIHFSIAQVATQRIKHLVGHKRKKTETQVDKGVTRASTLGILLRQVFLPIDIWRYKRLRKTLEQQGIDYILSDRYFYDTAVNIAFLQKASRINYRKIPRPEYSFFLRIEPEKIMMRRRAPEQGLSYLKRKQALYDLLVELTSIRSVNAEQTKEQVFDDIIKHITTNPEANDSYV